VNTHWRAINAKSEDVPNLEQAALQAGKMLLATGSRFASENELLEAGREQVASMVLRVRNLGNF
jgi:hypothetical protein